MSVKLLIKHHLECLSLEGGCRGWYESTLVKIPHCWKLHITSHICYTYLPPVPGTGEEAGADKEPYRMVSTNKSVVILLDEP